MPLYLYLLRHAQSADKQHGQTDQGRQLTPRGMKQAMLVANFLKQEKIVPDVIICSSAERAKATAMMIADAIKINRDYVIIQPEFYEASPRTFFQLISQFEDTHQNVMCIAHNPSISYLAEYLTKAEIGEMVPAGMAIIQFNINSWSEVSEGNGTLLRYVHEETLRTI